MRIIRQTRATGPEVFRLRVWKKKVYIEGWHVDVKMGGKQWLIVPNDDRRPERQTK